jgi:hypothetical protein
MPLFKRKHKAFKPMDNAAFQELAYLFESGSCTCAFCEGGRTLTAELKRMRSEFLPDESDNKKDV